MIQLVTMEIEAASFNHQCSAHTNRIITAPATPLPKAHVETEGCNFLFFKLTGILGFHMTLNTQQPKRRCVGGLGTRSMPENGKKKDSLFRWNVVAGTLGFSRQNGMGVDDEK